MNVIRNEKKEEVNPIDLEVFEEKGESMVPKKETLEQEAPPKEVKEKKLVEEKKEEYAKYNLYINEKILGVLTLTVDAINDITKRLKDTGVFVFIDIDGNVVYFKDPSSVYFYKLSEQEAEEQKIPDIVCKTSLWNKIFGGKNE